MVTHNELSENLAALDELYKRYDMDIEDINIIWEALFTFCLFQVQERHGAFFDEVKYLIDDWEINVMKLLTAKKRSN